MNWSLFTIRGSGGTLLMWHLVTPDGKRYRSRCGRMFLVKPELTSLAEPDDIRGVCRRCQSIGSK